MSVTMAWPRRFCLQRLFYPAEDLFPLASLVVHIHAEYLSGCIARNIGPLSSSFPILLERLFRDRRQVSSLRPGISRIETCSLNERMQFLREPREPCCCSI